MPSQMLIPSPPGDVAVFSHPEFRTQSCPEASSQVSLYKQCSAKFRNAATKSATDSPS